VTHVPRGSDLIGLPVLAVPQYGRIGRVQAVLLSPDGARLCGLALDGGGWLQHRRVLDFSAVRTVGPTHVLAEEVYLADAGGARCCQDLHGLPVLAAGGEEVGLLDDLYFDPATGQVTALQLSHGFVDDLLSGKEIVALSQPVFTGEAAIVLGGPGDLTGGAVSS
jgi:uncharacterized protein YrrD